MSRGWAISLLVLSVLAAGIAVIAVIVVSNNETVVVELDTGDCFTIEGDVVDEIGTVDTTDCDDPHDAEVVATGELNPGGDLDYPGDDVAVRTADRRCAATLEGWELLADYGILPAVANEQAWDPLDGRFVCIAIPYGGGSTTGSLASTVPSE